MLFELEIVELEIENFNSYALLKCGRYRYMDAVVNHVIYGNDLLSNAVKLSLCEQSGIVCQLTHCTIHVYMQALEMPNDNVKCTRIVCVSNKNLCTLLLFQEQWWEWLLPAHSRLYIIVLVWPERRFLGVNIVRQHDFRIYFWNDKI